MSVEPCRNAQRVFVVVDSGSAHRAQRSIDRLQGVWPNLDVEMLATAREPGTSSRARAIPGQR